MSGKVRTFEQAVLNIMRNTAPSVANAYVGLFTVVPTDTTGGTEVTGSSYARQLAGFSAPTETTPATITNGSDILFPVVTGSSYTVVSIGLFLAVSGGAVLCYVPAFTGVVIAVGGQARIAAGTLIYSEE